MLNDRAVLTRRRAFVCVAGMITTLRVGTMAAQQEPPQSTARAQVGPVSLSPTITVRDIGVDTNVFNQNADNRTQGNDFTFIVTPMVLATAGARRARASLRSTTDFVYFVQAESERSIDEDLNVSGQFSFGRFSPNAEVGYVTTRERLNQEVHARARRTERRGEVGVGIQLTSKIAASVTADFARMAYVADATFDNTLLAQELNQERHGVSGSLRFTATPLTTIVVTTDAFNTRFEHVKLRNTNSREILFGVDLNPRALVSGSARVGYQFFRPRSVTVPDFNGLVGSVGLSYRFRSSSALGFSFDRNSSFSYSPDKPYYIRGGFSLFIRQQLGAGWNIEMAGGRFTHSYREVTVTPLSGTVRGRTDQLVDARAILGYDVGPRTRFTTGISYQDVRSDIQRASYHGLHVGTSFTYGF